MNRVALVGTSGYVLTSVGAYDLGGIAGGVLAIGVCLIITALMTTAEQWHR